jgi:hypothetical protein
MTDSGTTSRARGALLAATGAVATALLLAGCGAVGSSPAGGSPAASAASATVTASSPSPVLSPNSAAVSPGAPTATAGSDGRTAPSITVPATGTPADSGTALGVHANATALLTDWLRHLLAGDYVATCQDMAAAAHSATPATVYGPARCRSMVADASLPGKAELASLRSALISPAVGPDARITVAGLRPAGTTAVESDTEVMLNGASISSILQAESTGLQPGRFTLGFALARIDGAWYLTAIDITASIGVTAGASAGG